MIENYRDFITSEKAHLMSDAHQRGRSCETSAIYAHYRRTQTLRPFVLALANSEYARDRLLACLKSALIMTGLKSSGHCYILESPGPSVTLGECLRTG